MKSRSSDDVVGGARGGLSLGMAQTFAYKTVNSKQQNARPLAVQSESLRDDVRKAMGVAARSMVADIPASVCPDRQFLHELARPDGRRDFDNLSRLIAVAVSTGQQHCVSDTIRALEIKYAAAESVCRFDASLYEGDTNASLNKAQELAVHEDTPTRWAQVWELCREQVRATMRLADAAARRMHLTQPRSV